MSRETKAQAVPIPTRPPTAASLRGTPGFPRPEAGNDAASSSAGLALRPAPRGSLGAGLLPIVYRRFSRPAIGVIREPVPVNSLIKKPCLHGPGRHPFRDLSRSGGFPPIIGRRVRWYFSAPSLNERFLPFHLGLPCGSAVVSGYGRSSDIITLPMNLLLLHRHHE